LQSQRDLAEALVANEIDAEFVVCSSDRAMTSSWWGFPDRFKPAIASYMQQVLATGVGKGQTCLRDGRSRRRKRHP
jgi:hypothetical protein